MQKQIEELVKEYSTNSSSGLNTVNVTKNRKAYGENKIKEKKKTNIFVKFLKSFKDSLILILMASAIISVILDPNEYVDSIIILVVVFFNSILGVIQETKAERSLEALKKMSSPTTKVIRNGHTMSIPSEELVVGDVMLIEAGDHISADARIMESFSLAVDESALTGESLPVHKDATTIYEENVSLGDKRNMVFSSTYITSGKAKVLVTQVGMNTEMGKIAGMLNEHLDATTPLQHKLSSVGKVIGIMSLIICTFVFILEMIAEQKNGSVLSKVWVDCFKTAIALAVAAIPEGLATVVTIVLAIGVGKMSKKNAIVKRLPAVETLGSCSVICSDKTGTLTQNKMIVQKLYCNDIKTLEFLNKKEKELLEYFAICCDATLEKNEAIGDPTEVALLEANQKYGNPIRSINKVLELPFDSDRKMMTTVIQEDRGYLAITKGAFDVIIARSTNPIDEKDRVYKVNEYLAKDALRVLAIGIQSFSKKPTASMLEKKIEFLGLVGMADPARPEVKEAIEIAKSAGIFTVMVTGDHITTATAVAKELGILDEKHKAITAQELDKISDEKLQKTIEEYSVFARVAPKDKVRIVEAWQKKDAIVAMTGDGVNDAPALKKADIGCAMGITGTDVSKEAADMILVDDNFSTIVSAVKQGRGIYDNIKKCVKYLLSSNIGEVFVIFMASLISALTNISMGVPLLPIHLLWINLITDSLPAFGIGMEEVEDTIMEEQPRLKKEGFFAHHMTIQILIEGFIIGMCAMMAYSIGHFLEHSHMLGQTMAFFTLSTSQLLHAFNVKSKHSIFTIQSYKNKFLNFAILLGFALQFIVVYCPRVNTLFKFTPLSFTNLVICLGLSLLICVYSELFKNDDKNNLK
ncbi:MAG: cation-translocating P-type ATPase [Roseburia sp.]|nr:cation-translocating P-type ATPase [Anaeroplasma bactoclasticum]MCM1196287.1 cation-translocating P-type ATPase [Roseburia sp.]MCM1557462.1 cation-translocating P-type ATPase [Anaeroplasma bactoclasticum]